MPRVDEASSSDAWRASRCWDSTRIPTASPSSARICRAAASPSTVWVGGIRTSTRATSGRERPHGRPAAPPRLPPPRRCRSPPAGAARPPRRAAARCPRPALRAREVHLDPRPAARRAEHVERAAGRRGPGPPGPSARSRGSRSRRRLRRRSPRLEGARRRSSPPRRRRSRPRASAALVSASDTAKYAAAAAARDGSTCSENSVRTASGDRSTRDSRAACSPDSSRIAGWMPRASRRTSSAAALRSSTAWRQHLALGGAAVGQPRERHAAGAARWSPAAAGCRRAGRARCVVAPRRRRR